MQLYWCKVKSLVTSRSDPFLSYWELHSIEFGQKLVQRGSKGGEPVIVQELAWHAFVLEVHIYLKRQVFDAGEDRVVDVAGQRAPDWILLTAVYQVGLRIVDAGLLARETWAVKDPLQSLVDSGEPYLPIREEYSFRGRGEEEVGFTGLEDVAVDLRFHDELGLRVDMDLRRNVFRKIYQVGDGADHEEQYEGEAVQNDLDAPQRALGLDHQHLAHRDARYSFHAIADCRYPKPCCWPSLVGRSLSVRSGALLIRKSI